MPHPGIRCTNAHSSYFGIFLSNISVTKTLTIHSLPAGGSSSSGGSWREDEGDDGVSGRLVVPVFPPTPTLGPDRARLR